MDGHKSFSLAIYTFIASCFTNLFSARQSTCLSMYSCILCVMDDPTYQTIQHWYIHKYMNNGTSSLSHMLRVSLSYDPLGIFFHPDEQGIVEKRLTLAFECLQQNCDFYTGVKRL